MPSLDAWRRYYDSWAGRDPHIASTGNLVSETELDGLSRWISELLCLHGTELALDVGCASATLTGRWARGARLVVGVDFSSRLLREAMWRRRGAPVVLSAAEASRLPFGDASFDRVVCFNVLCSSPDREHAVGAIRELVRVARPGARIVIGSLPDERCREQFHESVIAASPWHLRVRARVRAALLPRRPPTKLLWYDVGALVAELESLGCDVTVHEDARFTNYNAYRKTLVAVAGAAVGSLR